MSTDTDPGHDHGPVPATPDTSDGDDYADVLFLPAARDPAAADPVIGRRAHVAASGSRRDCFAA